jgi:hypothetical protein
VVTERRRPDTGPQLAGSVGRYTDPNSATRLNNIRVDRVYPIRCVITVASVTGHTHSASGTFRTPYSPERSKSSASALHGPTDDSPRVPESHVADP